MKDEILRQKVSKFTTYSDDVNPRQWIELVEELVSEINNLESELEDSQNRPAY